MSYLILLACSLVSFACSQLPDISIIQTAYERESTSGSKLHDKALRVLNAKCHDDAGPQVLCEVTFISTEDPSERLYFDIVAVAQTDDGWVLKSGLCKPENKVPR